MVNKGHIAYRTHEYWDKELGLHHGDVWVRGAKVYGPPEFLFVYKLDNTFICKARNATLWPPTQAEIAEAQAYQNQHMKMAERDAKKFLESFSGKDSTTRKAGSKTPPKAKKSTNSGQESDLDPIKKTTQIRRKKTNESA